MGYAFLVHLRNLLDFFYVTEGREDDLLAADFTTVFKRFSPVDAPTTWDLTAIKTEVSKRLAHLTAHRWRESPAPSMDFYDTCVPTINGLITAFRDVLPVDLKADLDAAMSRFPTR